VLSVLDIHERADQSRLSFKRTTSDASASVRALW
jgi:hypothetical protein